MRISWTILSSEICLNKLAQNKIWFRRVRPIRSENPTSPVSEEPMSRSDHGPTFWDELSQAMHEEESRVGLTDDQERERSRFLGSLYAIPSVRRNITSRDDDDDVDMSGVHKAWLQAGAPEERVDELLLYWQNRMLARTPWDDEDMTPEIRDWWKKRGWWKKNVVDNSSAHYSPPCTGNETGLSWEKKNLGWSVKEPPWSVKESSASSSGPYSSAPMRKGKIEKGPRDTNARRQLIEVCCGGLAGGPMSSTREQELGEEFFHGDEDSLEEVLLEQRGTGWYYGPGGPEGRIDEVD